MTGHRIRRDADIRLKQALACAELNRCDTCPDFERCQELDDKDLRKMFEPVRKKLHLHSKPQVI